MAGTCAIAVMAKASRPGRSKTRLCPPLTPDEAASFNTAFLKDVIANIEAAARSLPIGSLQITCHLAYGPPEERGFFEALAPASVGLVETWLPNFGANLFHAAATLLAAGHEAACVLNADSPTLPTRFLVEAADWLARPGERAVLGPSHDGGYYILGLKTPHRRLFEDIDWSTERVAAQTQARAAEIGLDLHILPTWYDVDDVEALRLLYDENFNGSSFDGVAGSPHEAVHTRTLLSALSARTDFLQRLGLTRDATVHPCEASPLAAQAQP